MALDRRGGQGEVTLRLVSLWEIYPSVDFRKVNNDCFATELVPPKLILLSEKKEKSDKRKLKAGICDGESNNSSKLSTDIILSIILVSIGTLISAVFVHFI